MGVVNSDLNSEYGVCAPASLTSHWIPVGKGLDLWEIADEPSDNWEGGLGRELRLVYTTGRDLQIWSRLTPYPYLHQGSDHRKEVEIV